MSSIEELELAKKELEEKKKKLESMAEEGVSWEILQPKIEECEGEIRKINEEIVKRKIGENEVARLMNEKDRVLRQLAVLKEMKERGEISSQTYKSKEKELKNKLNEIERKLVDAQLNMI